MGCAGGFISNPNQRKQCKSQSRLPNFHQPNFHLRCPVLQAEPQSQLPRQKTSPMPQKPLHPCPPASSSQDAGSQKSPALGTSAALSAQEEPGNCSCGRNDAAEVLRRPRGHRMVSKGVMPHGWCAQGQEQVQHSTVKLRGTCGLWLSCIVSTRPQRSPSSALDVNKHIQPHG